MAFEGEVFGPKSWFVLYEGEMASDGISATYELAFSSTYVIATRPSMLPMAKPSAAGKQATTRVCILRVDSND